MILGKKLVVVLPAYNAALTIEKTYNEIPLDIVDEVILVDDASKDNTIEVASRIGIKHIIKHEKNKGYGGNQKSCYDKALSLGADIVIMLHPDYQYTPKLIPSIANIIAQDLYPAVFGSRILGKGALKGGMPLYKYFFNRCLTFTQNVLMNQKLSEYHTGYRAFSKEFYAGYEIAEVTCPTKYFDEASSINFKRSAIYGLGVLGVSFSYFFNKMGLAKSKIFHRK
jgi:glycosyltransferase involved in cell wall biosynthesis